MSMVDYQLLKQIASGDMRGVDKLLSAGASIDGSRDLPTRPLVTASQTGQVGVLEMLICRGADLEVTSKEHIHFPLGSRALHAAAMHGQVGSMRCLMKAGANADVFNSAGYTPLMLAHYSPEMVAELLRGGANPSLANDQGTDGCAAHFRCERRPRRGDATSSRCSSVEYEPGTELCFPPYVARNTIL